MTEVIATMWADILNGTVIPSGDEHSFGVEMWDGSTFMHSKDCFDEALRACFRVK